MTVVGDASHPVATGAPVRGTGIVKRWGATTALDGATFTIGRGVTGLLGANGAGKTTLLGMVLGLHRPDEGALSVLGLDPSQLGPQVRARIGYSPEHHQVPPDVRAVDFVRHLGEVHGLPHREATNRASDVLWLVGLGEERFRPLGTMSTGQRQRVKLAQALVHDPALLLADEPTDGLDPVQRDEMLALIRRIGSTFGIDVVLSSHLLEEVERTCDNAVILREGRVVADGPLHELLGGGDGLVLDVAGTAAQATAVADLLRDRGAWVEGAGSRLVVRSATDGSGDADALADLVRDAVVDVGAGIRRLATGSVSLEQVFLELES